MEEDAQAQQSAANEIFGDTQRGGFVGKAGFKTKAEKEAASQSRDAKVQKERERIKQVKEERDKQREADRMRKEAAQEQARYVDSIKQTTKSMQKHATSIFKNWTTFQEQAYMEGAGSTKDDKVGKNNHLIYLQRVRMGALVTKAAEMVRLLKNLLKQAQCSLLCWRPLSILTRKALSWQLSFLAATKALVS